jgi:hypothetical protein
MGNGIIQLNQNLTPYKKGSYFFTSPNARNDDYRSILRAQYRISQYSIMQCVI